MKACLSHPEQHYKSSMVAGAAIKFEKWISEERPAHIEKVL